MANTINQFKELCKQYHSGGMTHRKREKLDQLLKMLSLEIDMDIRELLRDVRNINGVK